PLAAACWGGTFRELQGAVGAGRPLAGFHLWLPLGERPLVEWVVPAGPGALPVPGVPAAPGAPAAPGQSAEPGDPWQAVLAAAGAFAAAGLEPAWVGDAPGGVVGRI